MMDTYMLFHFLEVRSTEYFLLLQLLMMMVVVVVVVVVVILVLVIQRKLLSYIIYLYFLLLHNDIQSVGSTGLTTALVHRVLRRTRNYSIYSPLRVRTFKYPSFGPACISVITPNLPPIVLFRVPNIHFNIWQFLMLVYNFIIVRRFLLVPDILQYVLDTIR